ncbi:MAG: Gfo/Idh/MocA family oxidoreductase [Bradyrhizobium sp.]
MSAHAAGKRVAVIGLGRMGLRHLEAVSKLGMTIVGVADTSEVARETASTRFGVDESQCYAEGTEMLRSVRPDAVVVATTAPSHAPLVVDAAEAGVRHILCEKPMAVSLAEADEMMAACKRSGSVLAINHQMRFMEQYTLVKALIGSDELGPLVSVLVAASNFGLAMNACHYFEMFRYLSDAPISGIHAWFDQAQLANPRGPEFEDRAGRLLARDPAGRSMFIDFSMNAGSGIHVTYICRNGQIVVDEINGDMRVVARKSEYRDLPTSRYGASAEVRTQAIKPVDVVVPTVDLWSAMLQGKTFPDGNAGVHALACCVAAHVSHEAGGREILLADPALPRGRRFKWA